MSGLILGNALRIPLADGSVQCVVTSPPYWGLRDYGLPPMVWGGDAGCEHVWHNVVKPPSSGGKNNSQLEGGKAHQYGSATHEPQTSAFCHLCGAWRGCLGLEPTPELYVEHMVAVFREVRRVLRDDGTVWLNLGDSYAGGNYRGGGMNTASNKQRSNAGTLPFMAGRPNVPYGLKPKDLVGIPWRVAFALQADGWWLRSDVIEKQEWLCPSCGEVMVLWRADCDRAMVWEKPNCMPESVTDRPTKAHEYLFLLSKRRRYYYDNEAIKEPQTGTAHSRGKGITPKSVKPGLGIKANDSFQAATAQYVVVPGGRNKRSVWTIATQSYSGAHFATFPPDLVEPCVLAGTSERGACPKCGAPWKRVVETVGYERQRWAPGEDQYHTQAKGKHGRTSAFTTGDVAVKNTVGWRPTCRCYGTEPWPRYPRKEKEEAEEEYERRKAPIREQRLRLLEKWSPLPAVPCVVFDPFVGSGTTVAKAEEMGRHGIGADINREYVHSLAKERTAPPAKERTAQPALL